MPRVKCSECGTVQEWGILEDVECKECGAELFEPVDEAGGGTDEASEDND